MTSSFASHTNRYVFFYITENGKSIPENITILSFVVNRDFVLDHNAIDTAIECLQFLGDIEGLRYALDENWATLIRLCDRCQNFQTVLDSVLASNQRNYKDHNHRETETVSIWSRYHALDDLLSVFRDVVELSQRLVYNKTSRDTIPVQVNFRHYCHFDIMNLMGRLRDCASTLHVVWQSEIELFQEDVQDAKRYFGLTSMRICKEIIQSATGLSRKEKLLEEFKMDLQDQWQSLLEEWGESALGLTGEGSCINECEEFVRKLVDLIDNSMIGQDMDLMSIFTQDFMKCIPSPIRNRPVDQDLNETCKKQVSIIPLDNASAANLSLQMEISFTTANVSKLLQNVIDQYNDHRHSAISEWQFHNSVLRGFNDITPDHSSFLASAASELLGLWMESPNDQIDFTSFFLGLYRLDGSPKISDMGSLSRLVELMGDYYLFRAERKHTRKSTSSVNIGQGDYSQAMYFYTYAVHCLEKDPACKDTQDINDVVDNSQPPHENENDASSDSSLSFQSSPFISHALLTSSSNKSSKSPKLSSALSPRPDSLGGSAQRSSSCQSHVGQRLSFSSSSSRKGQLPRSNSTNQIGSSVGLDNEASHRLGKKQQQVSALYLIACFDSVVDYRLNQIVSDERRLKSMLKSLQTAGDLLIVDFPKQGQLCYRKMMSMVDHNKSAISAEDKHQLATLVVKQLGIPRSRYRDPRHHYRQKYEMKRFRRALERLANVRQSDHDFDEKCPARGITTQATTTVTSASPFESPVLLFRSWSNHMFESLVTMITDCVDQLGPSPVASEWCVVVCGSLARREACPYSDIEMFFLHRASPIPAQNPTQYLTVLAKLLELSVISMGETTTSIHSLGDNRLQMLYGGFQLDSNFNPSNNSTEMILSIDLLLDRMKTMDQVQLNLFCAGDYVYGSQTLFDEYRERVELQITNIVNTNHRWEDPLRDSVKEYLNTSSQRLWMKDHIKFLNVVLSQLCFHNGIVERSNIDRIDALQRNKKMDASLRNVLVDLLAWMTTVRCKLHLFYGEEREDFAMMEAISSTSIDGKGDQRNSSICSNIYVLSDYDRQIFRRYESHLKLMLLRLTQACYQTDRQHIVHVSRFEELSASDLANIADYWVLRSEDELSSYYNYKRLQGACSITQVAGCQTPERGVGNKDGVWLDCESNPHLLRSNLFFEYAVQSSKLGTTKAFKNHIVRKYVVTDSETMLSRLVDGTYEENGKVAEEYNKNSAFSNFKEFGTVEKIKKPNIPTKGKKETYGRCVVHGVGGSVHLKEYPELPGVEYLAISLAHLLTGYTCSFSTLCRFAETKPVLISKTVTGINLHDILREDPNFLETDLDSECYSWHIIRTLLLSPEDDKPDNFVVYFTSGHVENGTATHVSRKAKLVCVDNDHSFAVPIVKRVFQEELMVKSILFCSEKMLEPVHPNVVAAIKQWNPEGIIREWIDGAIKQDNLNCALFPSESLCQDGSRVDGSPRIGHRIGKIHNGPVVRALLGGSRSAIPMMVDPNLAMTIFLKMKGLQLLFENYESEMMFHRTSSLAVMPGTQMTHIQLLHHLEPELEKRYYGRVLCDASLTSTEERFNSLTKNLYKVVEPCRRSQVNTFKMLQSSLGKVPSERDIRERKIGSVIDMKEEFEAAMPPGWIQLAHSIQLDLLSGNEKLFWELPNDILREEVISGIWSQQGRSLVTGFDFKLLDEQLVDYSKVLIMLEQRTNSFQRLSLKNCTQLTDDRLIRILKRSPKLLILDIRGCEKLTPAVLIELPQYCPQLQQCMHKLDDGSRESDLLVILYRMLTQDKFLTATERVRVLGEDMQLEQFCGLILQLTALYILRDCCTICNDEEKERIDDISSNVGMDLTTISTMEGVYAVERGSIKNLSDKSQRNENLTEIIKPSHFDGAIDRPDHDKVILIGVDDEVQQAGNSSSNKIAGKTISGAANNESDISVSDVMLASAKYVFWIIGQGSWDDHDMVENILFVFLAIVKHGYSGHEDNNAMLSGFARFILSILGSDISVSIGLMEECNRDTDSVADEAEIRKELNTLKGKKRTSAILIKDWVCISLVLLLCKSSLFHFDIQCELQSAFIMLSEKSIFRSSDILVSVLQIIEESGKNTITRDIGSERKPLCSFDLKEEYIYTMKTRSLAVLQKLVRLYEPMLTVHIQNEVERASLTSCMQIENTLRNRHSSKVGAISYADRSPSKPNLRSLLRRDSFYTKQVFVATDATLKEAVVLWLTAREVAVNKYGHICTWNTSKVTTMKGLFKGAQKFNDPIGSWDVSNVRDMSYMFYNASSFNQPLHSWNTSNVTSMYLMFCGASCWCHINIVQSWDLQRVADVAFLFSFVADDATLREAVETWYQHRKVADMKYGPINTWDTSMVTDMSGLFKDITTFDEEIGSWDVGRVRTMRDMFLNASAFNQPLNNWNVRNVEDMSGMFYRATSFNQQVDKWDVSGVKNMSHMFYKAASFNQSLDTWDCESVHDMSYMFYNATAFNGSLGKWNVQKVCNMSYMFYNASSFNQPLHSWNTSNVTSMYLMFCGASCWCHINIVQSWDLQRVADVAFLFSFVADDATLREAVETWYQHRKVADMKYGPINTWDTSMVTDMSGLFKDITTFDEEIGSWDVGRVRTMRDMFLNASAFNQPLNNWNVRNVEDMSGMFYRATSFNQQVDKWDVSGVKNMSHMFYKAASINQSLDTWNVNNVQNMADMFHGASLFNHSLSMWNVGKVKDMSAMFCKATSFNQCIVPWNVVNVLTMKNMFHSAISFNQPLGGWETNNVEDMSYMFYHATVFNQPLESWNVEKVKDMSYMFDQATSFNQPLGKWMVSSVEDMSGMFCGATSFNQALSRWDVQKVKKMRSMFYNAVMFDQPLDAWDVGNVTTMSGMFWGALSFNQPVGAWDVSKVTDMSCMFNNASEFNQPMDSWNVSAVTNMSYMFHSAESFNQPLGFWDVGHVTNMSSMFQRASQFNQPLESWRLSRVTTMRGMFSRTISFDQPLNGWNVRNVTDMSFMFHGARLFNRPLESWDVGNVTSMSGMFQDATSFNQPLGEWNVGNVTEMVGIFEGASSFSFHDQLNPLWLVCMLTQTLEFEQHRHTVIRHSIATSGRSQSRQSFSALPSGFG